MRILPEVIFLQGVLKSPLVKLARKVLTEKAFYPSRHNTTIKIVFHQNTIIHACISAWSLPISIVSNMYLYSEWDIKRSFYETHFLNRLSSFHYLMPFKTFRGPQNYKWGFVFLNRCPSYNVPHKYILLCCFALYYFDYRINSRVSYLI